MSGLTGRWGDALPVRQMEQFMRGDRMKGFEAPSYGSPATMAFSGTRQRRPPAVYAGGTFILLHSAFHMAPQGR